MRRAFFALLCTPLLVTAQYQKPPQIILDVLNAPRTPGIVVSPAKDQGLLTERVTNPPIAEVARPMLRIGGMRIDPKLDAVRDLRYITGLSLLRFSSGQTLKLQTPPHAQIREVTWSPDGKAFAFLNAANDRMELWVGDASTGALQLASKVAVIDVMGRAVQWLPDSRTLLVQTVPANRGQAPASESAPTGPAIQESAGHAAPVRTYEDLLTSPHDEQLFDYYATTQLAFFDTRTGQLTAIGKPAIFEQVALSPDASFVLVSRIHKPYSYLHPATLFPRDVEILDRTGKLIHTVAKEPLGEIPIEGARKGPRNFHWRPDQPAALVWTEAMDGGNPKEKVPNRDRVLTLRAPFTGEAVESFKTKDRLMNVVYGEKSQALVTSMDSRSRKLTIATLNPDDGQNERVLSSRDMRDQYNAIGRPLVRERRGNEMLLQSGDTVFFAGNGASDQGDHPFLDALHLDTGKTERLFQNAEPAYEDVVDVTDPVAGTMLTTRETADVPPNYFLRNWKTGELRQLTHYSNSLPAALSIKPQLVTYARPDGVKLSFYLYLPPGYKPGTPLPTVFWGYPLEYSGASTAGQISGSTRRFTRLSGYSELFFALQGYAVLDNVAMPVVGDPETVNNTYVNQIVADAKAAIDKAAAMGVTDPARVGVGGHSYGAFMTANLLANCDLFRAGIARSGAYNRTLTPFGFQSERRTFWEAQDIYLNMSPFLRADKIKAPILFIHGEADDNQGTFPIQSERMYQAVRGNGGTARLVFLPHEAHAYLARETVEHVLWEMIHWFDKYVKGESTISSGE